MVKPSSHCERGHSVTSKQNVIQMLVCQISRRHTFLKTGWMGCELGHSVTREQNVIQTSACQISRRYTFQVGLIAN